MHITIYMKMSDNSNAFQSSSLAICSRVPEPISVRNMLLRSEVTLLGRSQVAVGKNIYRVILELG